MAETMQEPAELGAGGAEVNMYVQCTHPDGEVGTFLKDANGTATRRFADIVELIPWMREHGWELYESHSWRVRRTAKLPPGPKKEADGA